MAFVYICEACLAYDCENCQVNKDMPKQTPRQDLICGGGYCICGHNGEDENEWQKSVKIKMGGGFISQPMKREMGVDAPDLGEPIG